MSRDFSKGKIYKITNDYNDDIYVGSTCDTLGRRFSRHKADSKYKNMLIYKLMNEIGFERFRIQLIIDYPCEDQYQLSQKEGEYIRLMGTLNKKIEGRTKKEYRDINKDKMKEVKKEWYENNKDKIKENKKEWYKNNKDKVKEYYETNKDNVKEINKEYYETNKNKILEKIKCVCGCEVAKCQLNRHMKTKKHMNIMEQLNSNSNNEVAV